MEFTLALLTDPASKSNPPMAKRLSEISCPGFIAALSLSLFNLYFHINIDWIKKKKDNDEVNDIMSTQS